MANKYVQFVNKLFIVVLQRTLYKNSKVRCGFVKVFVYETVTNEVIEYLSPESFFSCFRQMTAKRFS